MRETERGMSGTLKKLGQLLEGGQGSHMCLLIGFVVAVFLLLYYLMRSSG